MYMVIKFRLKFLARFGARFVLKLKLHQFFKLKMEYTRLKEICLKRVPFSMSYKGYIICLKQKCQGLENNTGKEILGHSKTMIIAMKS